MRDAKLRVSRDNIDASVCDRIVETVVSHQGREVISADGQSTLQCPFEGNWTEWNTAIPQVAQTIAVHIRWAVRLQCDVGDAGGESSNAKVVPRDLDE